MRRSVVAALAALLAGPALAAEIDPGQSPGLRLLLDGLPGSSTEAAKTPSVDINANGMPIHLNETSLDEIAARLGGAVNTAGESENAIGWLCLASPDAGDAPPMLTWFVTNDLQSKAVTGIAVEIAPEDGQAGCADLKSPLALTTGLPLPGGPVADLDAVFGPAIADSGIPQTTAYVFGAEDLGDDVNIRRTEAKYIAGGTFIIAASIITFTEMK